MADCAACDTRLEEGVTKCPQCGATLKRPGSALMAMGWVILCIATIPLVVGAVSVQQQDYRALGVGIAFVVAGAVIIFIGRAKIAASPATTRPSAPPAAAPLPPAGPAGR